jgi:hypothetical protein
MLAQPRRPGLPPALAECKVWAGPTPVAQRALKLDKVVVENDEPHVTVNRVAHVR